MFAPCLILAHQLPSSTESRQRIERTVAAYRNNCISDIYLTSSYQKTSGVNIGYQMKRYLVEKAGIPISRIHYAPYGRNTAGEIAGFIRKLRQENRDLSALKLWACTSDYHTKRAEMLLKTYTNSVEVLAVDSQFPIWKRVFKETVEVIKIIKDSLFTHGRIKVGPVIEF